MGIQLVKAAFFHAERTGLGHAATRLLVHMAVEAYDDDNGAGIPPRRYFRSRADMAAALGFADMPERKPGKDAADSDRRAWQAGHERVKRALKDLYAAGAVQHIDDGRPGFNAEFGVTVSAVDPALLKTLTVPHDGMLTVPHDGMLTVLGVGRSPYPPTESTQQTDTRAEHSDPAQPQERSPQGVHKSDNSQSDGREPT